MLLCVATMKYLPIAVKFLQIVCYVSSSGTSSITSAISQFKHSYNCGIYNYFDDVFSYCYLGIKCLIFWLRSSKYIEAVHFLLFCPVSDWNMGLKYAGLARKKKSVKKCRLNKIIEILKNNHINIFVPNIIFSAVLVLSAYI